MGIVNNFWDHYSEKKGENLKGIDLLPLAHNTSYVRLRKILSSREFSPNEENEDEVLDEKLLFFYYGNPVFFRKNMIEPCMLVFKPITDEWYNYFNWSPIDSGILKAIRENKTIFKNDHFKEIDYETFKREYVLLTKNKKKNDTFSLLKSHIEVFFGSNENYTNGIVKKTLENNHWIQNKVHELYKQAPTKDDEIKELNEQLQREGYYHLDKRVKTVEGHYNSNIPLLNLDLVFCFVHDKEVVENMGAHINVENAKIETYDLGVDTSKNFITDGLAAYTSFIQKGGLST